MLERSSIVTSMNKLNNARRAQIVAALAEGNSIRATCRMTGAAKGTVLRLLVDLGTACADYQINTLVDLACERIQADEQWAFVHARPANLPDNLKGKIGYGDVFVWTAMCADTRAIVSWLVGTRDIRYARWFMDDLSSRLANRVQLTTDGLGHYRNAVDNSFGSGIDFGQVIKDFGKVGEDRRYCPPQVIGIKKVELVGSPDLAPYVHQLRRAIPPDRQDEHAAHDAVDQRPQQEDGEPGGGYRASDDGLQLRPEALQPGHQPGGQAGRG